MTGFGMAPPAGSSAAALACRERKRDKGSRIRRREARVLVIKATQGFPSEGRGKSSV